MKVIFISSDKSSYILYIEIWMYRNILFYQSCYSKHKPFTLKKHYWNIIDVYYTVNH